MVIQQKNIRRKQIKINIENKLNNYLFLEIEKYENEVKRLKEKNDIKEQSENDVEILEKNQNRRLLFK